MDLKKITEIAGPIVRGTQGSYETLGDVVVATTKHHDLDVAASVWNGFKTLMTREQRADEIDDMNDHIEETEPGLVRQLTEAWHMRSSSGLRQDVRDHAKNSGIGVNGPPSMVARHAELHGKQLH